jgi:hypothetical protein
MVLRFVVGLGPLITTAAVAVMTMYPQRSRLRQSVSQQRGDFPYWFWPGKTEPVAFICHVRKSPIE